MDSDIQVGLTERELWSKEAVLHSPTGLLQIPTFLCIYFCYYYRLVLLILKYNIFRL